jgi:hypothetical protein
VLCYYYNPQFFHKDTAKEGRSCLHGRPWTEYEYCTIIVLVPVYFSTYVLSCYEGPFDLQISVDTTCRRNNVLSNHFLIYTDENP